MKYFHDIVRLDDIVYCTIKKKQENSELFEKLYFIGLEFWKKWHFDSSDKNFEEGRGKYFSSFHF